MNTRLISLFVMLIAVAACDKYEIDDIQSESFVKFYNPAHIFKGADAKQTDDGYALLGTVQTFSQGRQICLLMTDKFGNVPDTARYYGRSLDDNAYSLKILPDGFAILGSSENPSTGKLEAYVIRTDMEGDTLWTRTISTGEDTEALHFETDSRDNFIMTGYTRNPLTYDKQIWLFAIDGDGEDLWLFQRIMGGDRDEQGVHLQVISDDRIAITGWSLSYTRNTGKKTQFILITNNSGGVVSFIPVRDVSSEPAIVYDEEASCIRMLGDGNYLLVGTTATVGQGTDVLVKKISLASSNFVPVWVKTFGTSGNDLGISALTEGAGFNILATTSSPGNNSAITIINIDSGGNNPDYFTFGDGSKLAGKSFDRTDDNGFIIAGSNEYLETHASGVLIRLKPGRSL